VIVAAADMNVVKDSLHPTAVGDDDDDDDVVVVGAAKPLVIVAELVTVGCAEQLEPPV